MARPKIILQSEYPYSVSARSRNRDWFDLPLNEVWQITSDLLHFCKHAFELKIHQYVLLNNHFHLTVSTPKKNLSEAMAYFLKGSSLEIQRISKRTNQIFGSRYYRTIISKPHHYLNSYKYIYRNPVKAGLCMKVESYPYSTLNALLGLGRLTVPVENDTFLFSDVESTLAWLNRTPNPTYELEMSKALRRATFTLRSYRKRPSALEHELL